MHVTSLPASLPRVLSTIRQLVSMLAELLILALAVAFIWSFLSDGPSFLFLLPAWALLSLGYIVAGGVVLFVASRRATAAPPARLPRPLSLASRVLSSLLPYGAGLVGIFAVWILLIGRGVDASELMRGVELTVAVDQATLNLLFTQLFIVLPGVAIVISWFMLQIAFANVYRHVDEEHPNEEGLDFPRAVDADRVASRLDYLYFAFTIGSSFAASDVTVQSQRVRWIVLVHNVLSYFFNAGVVAIAITTLTSLRF